MCKILIIEDEVDIREALSELLVVLGHEVIAAGDGLEALRLLDDHRSAPPCVILLDLRMPVMDGWEFLRRLRQSNDFAKLAVIVLSASLGMENDQPLVRAEGHWRKPVSIEQLEAISDFCALHREPTSALRRSRPDFACNERRSRGA
jgi:CheY-like chemotaxis protein